MKENEKWKEKLEKNWKKLSDFGFWKLFWLSWDSFRKKKPLNSTNILSSRILRINKWIREGFFLEELWRKKEQLLTRLRRQTAGNGWKIRTVWSVRTGVTGHFQIPVWRSRKCQGTRWDSWLHRLLASELAAPGRDHFPAGPAPVERSPAGNPPLGGNGWRNAPLRTGRPPMTESKRLKHKNAKANER